MKFGKSVLLEIVNIIQHGLVEGIDVSEMLRQIDVQENGKGTDQFVELSNEYKSPVPENRG